MFTSLFVVFLVEAADQLLEHRAHAVVVQCGQLDPAIRVLNRQRGKIDLGVEKVIDQVTEDVSLDHRLDLVSKFEFRQNVLNVRREAVQVINEVVA